MSSPEPSILAANDDCADAGTTSFVTDLSIGSLFTKALLILLFVFVVIRVSITIFRSCRGGNHQQSSHRGDGVPDSSGNNPDGHHDEENPVHNGAAGITPNRVLEVEAVISSYPSFLYCHAKADERNNTTCPICMCEYLESEMIRMMPKCGHYFHLICLDEWLRINWSCPVCRDSPSLQHAPTSSSPQATPSLQQPTTSSSQDAPSSSSCD
ncbi:RING-H2 finger protein ATL68-like [Neltuma alba]|uniref:RING-H2 finger protein ATL68-like n=1 Tax=Neltuma alba TaxID=207710 RepID=UPI0010A4C7F8|nr:RING-H2 finger protein ATL68-like [Prosopis alba]